MAPEVLDLVNHLPEASPIDPISLVDHVDKCTDSSFRRKAGRMDQASALSAVGLSTTFSTLRV
ncbi:MAG: hypothetical protein ABSE70_02615 [Candidatus Limnocylindrales bacterium]